ncbi:E3 ubiquitin-protein ligase RNF12-B-like isoform X2 [Saccostrea echinata]|uniref:E3 ubiquitin-protein ligase RNF12-B-like isoform X2 n=1 Tax=Saccostrea echinata TaxID=191078 RepID=UPI002A7FC852|nr:E3 ubiquitin-protein ligase RNF12-B-like isoform X2 [Saccostrea echinata]
MRGRGLDRWICQNCSQDLPVHESTRLSLSTNRTAQISIDETRPVPEPEPMDIEPVPEPVPEPDSEPEPVPEPDSTFHVDEDFDIPDQLHESSLVDDGVDQILLGTTPAPVTYHIEQETSQRGKKLLITSDGFSFTVRMQRGERTYWWCSVRPKVDRCRATITQKGDLFQPGAADHNHAPKPSLRTAAIVKRDVC